MIKIILIAALAISAHALGTAATCTGTYSQCAQCTNAAQVSATTAEVCATCNAGFSLPQTLGCTGSACTASIANCLTCASATPTVCSACQTGYGLDSTNNVCVSCSAGATGYTGAAGSGVSSCTVSSSKVVTATGCTTGMGLSLDTFGGFCVNCNTGKATGGTNAYTGFAAGVLCTVNAATTVTAVSPAACTPGYGLDAQSGCGSCTLSATSGLYPAGDANAATCTFTGPNTATYTYVLASCATGYALDGAASPKVCVSCSTGKTAAGATTYTQAVAGAQSCTAGSSKVSAVTACLNGYGIDSTNSACISCSTGKGTSAGATAYTYTGFDANCATCTSTTSAVSCLSCNSGYFLFYNGTCGNGTVNDTSCQYFANQVHCVQCKTNYYTQASNACVTCPSNCNLCDSTGKVCSVCGTGYKLSTTATGTCVPNGANIIMPGFALLSIIFYYLF